VPLAVPVGPAWRGRRPVVVLAGGRRAVVAAPRRDRARCCSARSPHPVSRHASQQSGTRWARGAAIEQS